MSKVQDESFFNIYGWMTNKLHLKGLELMVYGLIHGFTERAENRCFTGSLSYMADFTGATINGVQKAVKGLISKNLIIKHAVVSEGVRYCIYTTAPLDELLQAENEDSKEKDLDLIIQESLEGIQPSCKGVYNTVVGGIQPSCKGYTTELQGGIQPSCNNKIDIYDRVNDSLNDSINDSEINKKETKEEVKKETKKEVEESTKTATKPTAKTTAKKKRSNPSTPKRKSNAYEKPTLEQVQARIIEKQFNVNAIDFFDYYEASDWCDKDGKPIQYWKRQLKTWNDNSRLYDGNKSLWAKKEAPIDQSLIDILSTGL